ncbi:hypothetical protein [Clostridium sp. E02]|uniref:hypothetical protein n=1 Tax=Clostridium sp. E02 TaxID=2487134 RepID=UPI000F521C84|nr:hypothetical protein [Clostridium sp. E02]
MKALYSILKSVDRYGCTTEKRGEAAGIEAQLLCGKCSVWIVRQMNEETEDEYGGADEGKL